MENVVLTIHLILSLLLIGVVLLQRSEGGGLGMGGGGGGTMSARGAATGLSKMTWILAACFIATSLTLTILATRGSDGGSVVDSLTPGATDGAAPGVTEDGAPATPGLSGDLLPPAASDAPATPPRADEPAAPATNP